MAYCAQKWADMFPFFALYYHFWLALKLPLLVSMIWPKIRQIPAFVLTTCRTKICKKNQIHRGGKMVIFKYPCLSAGDEHIF